MLITQSAVSHHLRRLERELGVELFVRRARGMDLTAAGRRYFEIVHQAFGLIADGTAELRAGAASERVRVSLLPSFTAHWLAPRLERFRAAHPSIELDLEPTLLHGDFDREGVEVAIRYGAGRWPGMTATLLMTERLTPVAAPAQAGALARLPLLITMKEFEWVIWSRETGSDFSAAAKLQLTDYNIAIQAALNGQGLLLGRLRLVGDLLRAGALVAPFDQQVESPKAAYWVVRPEGRRLSPAAERFVDWLSAEAQASDAKHTVST